MRSQLTIAEELEQYAEHNMSISGQNVMREAAAAIRAQVARIADLEKLLKQLRQWDQLDVAEDGPYWKQDIDRVLNENR